MPVEVLSAMPPHGPSVRLPCVAHYFSLRVRDESDALVNTRDVFGVHVV